MLGVLFSLLATLGFGSTVVFARVAFQHMHVTTGTLASLVVSTALTMSIAVILSPHEIAGLSAEAYAWIFLAGLLTFPVGRLLNYASTYLVGVARASPIVGSSPLFATALAVVLTGESLNAPIILGTLAIIGGVALILGQQ
jgi:drug/metabolite transporter (DMT)-like permease